MECKKIDDWTRKCFYFKNLVVRHVVSHMFKHPAFFKFLKVHYKPPTFTVCCWGKTGCGYVRVSSTGKLSDLPVLSSHVKPCFYSNHRVNRKAVFNCIVCAACWLNVLLSMACWVLLSTASNAFVALFTSWHASAFDRRLEKNPLVLKALCNFEQSEFCAVILSSALRLVIHVV